MPDLLTPSTMHVLLLGSKREMLSSLVALGVDFSILYEPWEESRVAPFRRKARHWCAVDSYHSIESLLSALRHVNVVTPIDAIVATGETGIVPAAILGQMLGAKALSVDVAMRARDKALQKQAWKEAGVSTAAYVVVPDVLACREQIPQLLAQANIVGPYVAKPIAMYGTRNVHHFSSQEALIERCVAIASQDASMRRLLIEQWIAGEEWHFDGYCIGGEIAALSMARYREPLLQTKSGACTASITYRPAEHAELYCAGRRFASHALSALGLTDTVFHLEAFKSDDSFDFIAGELGARPAGNYIAPVVRSAFGVDLWDAHTKLSVGHAPASPGEGSELAWGFTDLPSVAGQPNTVEAKHLERLAGVREVSVSTPLGTPMRDMTTSSAFNIGHAVVAGETEEQCEQLIAAVQEETMRLHRSATT